eukprot:TRINITY_DN28478_c0_g1_i1.p1 TRINITY_DN28478_c0_g1~~TRINITY_DN28478_c0_g1_i1.p1  ORF type:complete len:114 (+),score=18.56 TRINITY_DN28478_c0_g1_i1:53-394(+)
MACTLTSEDSKHRKKGKILISVQQERKRESSNPESPTAEGRKSSSKKDALLKGGERRSFQGFKTRIRVKIRQGRTHHLATGDKRRRPSAPKGRRQKLEGRSPKKANKVGKLNG